MVQETSDVVALNADVVGYSRLIADDREGTIERVEELRRLVEAEVGNSEGTLINFVGDNFMAVFPSAEEAMRVAIAITTAIEDSNSDVPSTRQVRFRMGIDQGEVTITNDQYHGDALNIAARIQSIAVPGGISVSGRVYRALDEPELRFRSIGPQRLHNIPEDTDVYEFASLPLDRPRGSGRQQLRLQVPVVAVLPIHNENVDESVQRASEVIRSDLVHRLSRVAQLEVIDAKADTEAPPEFAATYMIETGVHQLGDRVRIFADLVDVTTWNVVKSHKRTVEASALFDVSEELANEVARSIEVELIIGEPAALYDELDDPEAIQKIYLGWYHLGSDTEQGWSRAVQLFGEVAEMHPDHPYGHSLSAFANWIAASNEWGTNPEDALELSRTQARRALAVGDPTGMGATVEAAVLLSQGRLDDALSALENIEIVRPTCDVTYGLQGSIRRYLGEWDQSIDLLDVAMRLTAVDKPWYATVQACSLFGGGRVERAAALAEAVLEHHPNNLEALLVLAAAQVELGLDRRAHATVETLRDRFPGVDPDEWLDRAPYRDRDLIERWKKDLAIAGAVAT